MATTSELLEETIYEKDRIAYMVEGQSRLLDTIKDTLEEKTNGNIGGGTSGIADILLKQFIENTITEIVIPNNVTNIGIGGLAFRLFLTSIVIPNSVTSIGEGAFINCIILQDSKKSLVVDDESNPILVIPNSVTSIGSEAFEGCSGLEYVKIGNSVTSIGFRALPGVRFLIIDATTPPTIDGDTFYAIEGILVPNGYKDTYKNATNWSKYANIIHEMNELPFNIVDKE